MATRALLCLFVTAVGCSTSTVEVKVEVDVEVGDGGGGGARATVSMSCGGGDGGGGGGGGKTTEDLCHPSDPFVGWDSCWRPDALCCADLFCLDVGAMCAADAGGFTEPYLCADVPAVLDGIPTDGRACAVLQGGFQIDCAWGASAVLCCEP
jgi:hypothetical protein